jgi:hypothetical protein
MPPDGSDPGATLRALEAIREEMAAIRDSIGRWDQIITRLKTDNIAGLFTRKELVTHDLYAFRNLVLARVNHLREGAAKGPWTGQDAEYLIYGSRLGFVGSTVTHPETKEPVDGIRLGLEKGLNFRLSVLSPLPDVRDNKAIQIRRDQALETLDFFLKVKREAPENWLGGFLLTATPQLLSDSFSSLKIGCDRRVSVLAASKHDRVTEYVFDESPVSHDSVASELRRSYYDAYDQETFPILMHNWNDLPQELLSVRVIVFAGRDWVITGTDNPDEPWISWEFPWEDVSRPEQIFTHKLVHSINAPDCLRVEPLTDIVFVGNLEGSEERRHILFLARQPRSTSENPQGLFEVCKMLKFFTGSVLERIHIYLSAISR